MADPLIDQYLEQIPTKDLVDFGRGRIYIAPALFHLDKDYKVLRMGEGTVGPTTVKTPFLTPASKADGLFNHAPQSEFATESKEEMLAVKGKFRPVIILSGQIMDWSTKNTATGGKRASSKIYLCAPIYSFDGKYEKGFVDQIKEFRFRELFYLPAECGLIEGFARFDHIQPINQNQMRSAQPPARLTKDANVLFEEWLKFYLFGTTPEVIEQYQKDLSG